jgi:hypothetical protein
MNTGQVVGPVTRWLMSPPGWAMYLLLAGAVLVSLWACVVPTRRGEFSDHLSELLLMSPAWWWRRIDEFWWDFDVPLGRFLLGAALWTLLALAWIVRRVARGVTVRRVSRQKAATFAYWRRWLVVPVVFGVTVLVCMTRLPTYAGFWLSRPWLDRAALEARGTGYVPPHTIGLFTTALPRRGGWALVPVRYEGAGTVAVHLSWDVDFVRCDSGNPPLLAARQVARRLSANWFLVESDRVSN